MNDCQFPGHNHCGTAAGYAHGCRAVECKAGASQYRRELRLARTERVYITASDRPLQIPDAWADDAACKGMNPGVFLPERGGDFRLARKTCATCPVQAPCLELALENDERLGIWGNTTPDERAELLKQRRSA